MFTPVVAFWTNVRSSGCAPTYVGERGAGVREQAGQAARDEVDRLALELALPRLVALEHRPRAGAVRAMVQIDDVRVEEEQLFHAPEYVVRRSPYRG